MLQTQVSRPKALKRVFNGSTRSNAGHIDKKGKLSDSSVKPTAGVVRAEAAYAELVKTCDALGCTPLVAKIAHELYALSEKREFFRSNTNMRPIVGACVLHASRMALKELSLRHLCHEMAVEMKFLAADLNILVAKITPSDEAFSMKDMPRGPGECLDILYIR
ncbi:hypothetical protein FRB95_003037 [Tulasnella sp. JGI-2019a]|nr:hypothetical protein FRB95_003037 [Tulasnella sp. JGI-2019a]